MDYQTPEYQTPGSVPPPQVAPNSTMAIVSIIAGIAGVTIFPFLGSIIAVITGYMARNEIRDSGGALAGEGLATIGMALGWIGIGLGVITLCILGFVFGLSFCTIFAAASESGAWLAPLLATL